MYIKGRGWLETDDTDSVVKLCFLGAGPSFRQNLALKLCAVVAAFGN